MWETKSGIVSAHGGLLVAATFAVAAAFIPIATDAGATTHLDGNYRGTTLKTFPLVVTGTATGMTDVPITPVASS